MFHAKSPCKSSHYRLRLRPTFHLMFHAKSPCKSSHFRLRPDFHLMFHAKSPRKSSHFRLRPRPDFRDRRADFFERFTYERPFLYPGFTSPLRVSWYGE